MATFDGTLLFGVKVDDTQTKREIDRAVGKAGGYTLKLNDKMSQPLGVINKGFDQFDKSLSAAATRVVAFGATAGIVYKVGEAFKSIFSEMTNVEKKLIEINTILNTDAAGLDAFRGSLFQIAKDTAKSFNTVSEAALEFSRQGLSVEETLRRTKDALILTRLSGLSAEDSVKNLTAALNGFNKEALTSADVINKVASLDAAFAVSAQDLAQAISRVSSVASDANVSFNELMSLVTAVQQTTARGGAVIGNAFKTIFTRIGKETTIDALRSLGVEINSAMGGVEKLQAISAALQTADANTANRIKMLAGGTHQINIVTAALADLSKEYSIYSNAMRVASNETNEAIKRNEALNQSISAMSERVKTNLQDVASRVGDIGFKDSTKSWLTLFNDISEMATSVLDGDSIGEQFGQGIVRGVANFIKGPALAGVLGAILKMSFNFAQGIAKSAQSLVGITAETQKQQMLEQQIGTILNANYGKYEQQLKSVMGIRQVEAEILNILSAQSTKMATITAESAAIARNLAAYASVGKATGALVVSKTVPKKSSGYIPNAADGIVSGMAQEAGDISKGIGGARPFDRPVLMDNFNFGTRTGPIIAHTGEKIVENFLGGKGSAIFNRQMIRAVGGEKRLGKFGDVKNVSKGYVPSKSKSKKINRYAKGFGGAVTDAMAREVNALVGTGYGRNAAVNSIRVGSSEQLRNPMNPAGFGVFNALQGQTSIQKAVSDHRGENITKAGASQGYVPNMAITKPIMFKGQEIAPGWSEQIVKNLQLDKISFAFEDLGKDIRSSKARIQKEFQAAFTESFGINWKELSTKQKSKVNDLFNEVLTVRRSDISAIKTSQEALVNAELESIQKQIQKTKRVSEPFVRLTPEQLKKEEEGRVIEARGWSRPMMASSINRREREQQILAQTKLVNQVATQANFKNILASSISVQGQIPKRVDFIETAVESMSEQIKKAGKGKISTEAVKQLDVGAQEFYKNYARELSKARLSGSIQQTITKAEQVVAKQGIGGIFGTTRKLEKQLDLSKFSPKTQEQIRGQLGGIVSGGRTQAIRNNAFGIAIAGSMASGILEQFAENLRTPEGRQTTAGKATTVGASVLGGVAAGALFGPVGMAVGGLAFGLVSLTKAMDSAKEESDALTKSFETQSARSSQNLNAFNTYIQTQDKLNTIIASGGREKDIQRLSQDMTQLFASITDPSIRSSILDVGNDITKLGDAFAKTQAVSIRQQTLMSAEVLSAQEVAKKGFFTDTSWSKESIQALSGGIGGLINKENVTAFGDAISDASKTLERGDFVRALQTIGFESEKASKIFDNLGDSVNRSMVIANLSKVGQDVVKFGDALSQAAKTSANITNLSKVIGLIAKENYARRAAELEMYGNSFEVMMNRIRNAVSSEFAYTGEVGKAQLSTAFDVSSIRFEAESKIAQEINKATKDIGEFITKNSKELQGTSKDLNKELMRFVETGMGDTIALEKSLRDNALIMEDGTNASAEAAGWLRDLNATTESINRTAEKQTQIALDNLRATKERVLRENRLNLLGGVSGQLAFGTTGIPSLRDRDFLAQVGQRRTDIGFEARSDLTKGLVEFQQQFGKFGLDITQLVPDAKNMIRDSLEEGIVRGLKKSGVTINDKAIDMIAGASEEAIKSIFEQDKPITKEQIQKAMEDANRASVSIFAEGNSLGIKNSGLGASSSGIRDNSTGIFALLKERLGASEQLLQAQRDFISAVQGKTAIGTQLENVRLERSKELFTTGVIDKSTQKTDWKFITESARKEKLSAVGMAGAALAGPGATIQVGEVAARATEAAMKEFNESISKALTVSEYLNVLSKNIGEGGGISGKLLSDTIIKELQKYAPTGESVVTKTAKGAELTEAGKIAAIKKYETESGGAVSSTTDKFKKLNEQTEELTKALKITTEAANKSSEKQEEASRKVKELEDKTSRERGAAGAAKIPDKNILSKIIAEPLGFLRDAFSTLFPEIGKTILATKQYIEAKKSESASASEIAGEISSSATPESKGRIQDADKRISKEMTDMESYFGTAVINAAKNIGIATNTFNSFSSKMNEIGRQDAALNALKAMNESFYNTGKIAPDLIANIKNINDAFTNLNLSMQPNIKDIRQAARQASFQSSADQYMEQLSGLEVSGTKAQKSQVESDIYQTIKAKRRMDLELGIDTAQTEKEIEDFREKIKARALELDIKINIPTGEFSEFGKGFMTGIEEMKNELDDFASRGKQVANTVADGFASAFTDAIANGQSFGDSMRSLFAGIASDLSKYFAKKAFVGMISAVAGGGYSTAGMNKGGIVKLASGGQPKKKSALVMGGEYHFGPEVVGAYGVDFFKSLNAGKIDAPNGLSSGGSPSGASQNGSGLIKGGSGNRDDLFGYFDEGSFILRKSAVNKYGTNFLDSIATGSGKQYTTGGKVQRAFVGAVVGEMIKQALIQAAIQAAIGAATAKMTGNDWRQGALIGGVSGALMGGFSGYMSGTAAQEAARTASSTATSSYTPTSLTAPTQATPASGQITDIVSGQIGSASGQGIYGTQSAFDVSKVGSGYGIHSTQSILGGSSTYTPTTLTTPTVAATPTATAPSTGTRLMASGMDLIKAAALAGTSYLLAPNTKDTSSETIKVHGKTVTKNSDGSIIVYDKDGARLVRPGTEFKSQEDLENIIATGTFAEGGLVERKRGKITTGAGVEDDVYIQGKRDEFMMNSSAAKIYNRNGLLDRMNEKTITPRRAQNEAAGIMKFEDGGTIGGESAAAASSFAPLTIGESEKSRNNENNSSGDTYSFEINISFSQEGSVQADLSGTSDSETQTGEGMSRGTAMASQLKAMLAEWAGEQKRPGGILSRENM